jgi:hypothetical protein
MTLQLQGNSQAQGPQASQTWISLPMQLSNRTLLGATPREGLLKKDIGGSLKTRLVVVNKDGVPVFRKRFGEFLKGTGTVPEPVP